tara:strand:- start:1042 stop:1689 length:648 start_codon:yes stop_codon:yes gene_type:complete
MPGEFPVVSFTRTHPVSGEVTTYGMQSIYHLNRLAVAGYKGRYWYRNSHRAIKSLAAATGLSKKQVAQVCAVTSPQVPVARNWKYTVDITTAMGRGASLLDLAHSYPGLIPSVRSGLVHLARGGGPRGPKTEPFSRALVGDTTALTLDVWMAYALNVPQPLFSRKWARALIVPHCLKAADMLGMKPAHWQASVWTGKFQQVHGAGSASASILGVK